MRTYEKPVIKDVQVVAAMKCSCSCSGSSGAGAGATP
jgi:hypothetical protein